MASSPPETDPEEPSRRLARQLGAVRRRGASLDEASWADAALVDALRETVGQRDADRPIAPTATQSDRMWAAIEAEMEPAPSPAGRLGGRLSRVWRVLTRPSTLRWGAAAAAALVAAFIAVWALLWTGGPAPVAVSEGQMRTYTTPGGATVQLRPHSALYPVRADTVRRYRLRGEAHFSVPPRAQGAAFEVQTDEARVRVLGTRFVVRTWDEGTDVYLDEGTVRLAARARGASSRRMEAGQRAAVLPDGQVTPPTPAPRSVYLGWLDQTLAFEERPLRRIVDELEHHYDLTIRMPDSVLEQTLTGQIPLDDQQQSLHDLAVVLGGRFERVDDRTYRFVAP